MAKQEVQRPTNNTPTEMEHELASVRTTKIAQHLATVQYHTRAAQAALQALADLMGWT